MVKIINIASAAICKVDEKPSIPAGIYFVVYFVFWIASGLSTAHLVNADRRLLTYLMPASTVTYGAMCHWLECIVLSIGAVAALFVPVVMLCAQKFRTALKTLVIGLLAVGASYAFSFLTETMLFVISLSVDNAG